MRNNKLILLFSVLFALALYMLATSEEATGKPPVKSKFYDFSEQIINGEIKKPTALFTDAREKVKFDRLLKLKKSFLPSLLETSKEGTFK